MTKTSNEPFKILSLFSGCGGLDLGFAQAREKTLNWKKCGLDKPSEKHFKTVWANDVFEPSCRTYSHNFDMSLSRELKSRTMKSFVFCGEVEEIRGDFRKVADENEIDGVLGGYPCQDFSVVRGSEKRKGVDVKRGRLYCHFVHSLITLQPKFFIAENVMGLVSANNGIAYEQIKDDFKELNIRHEDIEAEYEEELNPSEDGIKPYKLLFSDIVDFSKLGVPQGRKRLIMIGIREDLADKIGKKLWKLRKKEISDSLLNGETPLSKAPLTPIETFYGKVLDELQEKYQNIMKEYEDEIHEITSERQKEYVEEVWPNYTFDIWKDFWWINSNKKESNKPSKVEVVKAHNKVLEELGYKEKELPGKKDFEDNSNELLREMDRIRKRMKHIPPDENHEFVKNTEHHVNGLMSNIYRRIHPLKPSPTIIARGGGGTWGYHYSQNRQRMTNRERARLQTFPDCFLFKGKSGEVRRQLGEAVPPLASKKIAEEILSVLEEIKNPPAEPTEDLERPIKSKKIQDYVDR